MTKRRGAGEGHVERITLRSGRAAWRGWITVGYKVNAKGTRTPIRRTAQRRTRDAVRDALAQLRAKYHTQIDFAAEVSIRLASLFERWLAHFCATTEHKKRTPGTYRWAIDRALKQMGDPLAARVTPLECQGCLDALAPELKPASLKLVRVVLDGAFGQAVIWGIRPDNPAADLKIPRVRDAQQPERLTVGPGDIDRYLSALRAERLGLAVGLCYGCGLRPSEAVALRVADIVDTGYSITITVAGAHNRIDGAVERERTKSRRGARELPVPVGMHAWVRERVNRVKNEWRMLADVWAEPDRGLLFVRETDGGMLSGGMVYHVARRVAEAVGLGKVGPRVLRRSLLTNLAAQGVDPKVRAAIGGHTPAITEKHYHEVEASAVWAALEGIEVELGAEE